MLSWMTTTTLGRWAATIIISMVPVIELRGGIPYGVGFGLPYWQAFAAAFIGNMIPIPFIILLLRRIFDWLKTYDKTRGVVERLESRAHLKGEKVMKYRNLGLFILVAIPLPGTGAWTGALVASVLDIRMRNALPIIALGVITAGVIVLLVTHGVTILI
ncbi:MAG: small multi-drug export protein [Anaerovoracaceae bacterium]|nr:small multi-drug export protein [Anaerovoracaceae bacterium]